MQPSNVNFNISISDILSLLALITAIVFGIYNNWYTTQSFKATKYPVLKVILRSSGNPPDSLDFKVTNLSSEVQVSALNTQLEFIVRKKILFWWIPLKHLFWGIGSIHKAIEPKETIDFSRHDLDIPLGQLLLGQENIEEYLLTHINSDRSFVAKLVNKGELIVTANIIYRPGFWRAKELKLVEKRRVYYHDNLGFFIGQYTNHGLSSHRV